MRTNSTEALRAISDLLVMLEAAPGIPSVTRKRAIAAALDALRIIQAELVAEYQREVLTVFS